MSDENISLDRELLLQLYGSDSQANLALKVGIKVGNGGNNGGESVRLNNTDRAPFLSESFSLADESWQVD